MTIQEVADRFFPHLGNRVELAQRVGEILANESPRKRFDREFLRSKSKPQTSTLKTSCFEK